MSTIPHTARSLLLAALLAGLPAAAWTAGAQDEAAGGPLGGLLEVLEAHGYDVSLPSARAAVIEGAARSFDPGARLLDDPERARWQAAGEGRAWRPALRVGFSNGVCRVSGEGLEDASLLRIGTPFEEVPVLPDLLRRLRGGEGPLRLETGLEDGTVNTVTVARSMGDLEPMPLVETWPEGIGYLLVQSLAPGSGRQVADRLLAWNRDKLSGAILDLRGAGGGDLESARILAGLFAPEQETLFTLAPLNGDPARSFKRPEGAVFLDIPVMVLVDGSTTGAAELLAAACRRGLRGAMLLGQTTAGDFQLRSALALPRGGSLLIATQRLVTADGTVQEAGEGLVPDIRVEPGAVPPGPMTSPSRAGRKTLATEENHIFIRQRVGRDPVLGRAADLLLGLKALNIRSLAQPTNHTP